ncbi:MAG: prepilin peptidase [Candidatus Melainabacteria bacterium]|nr:prepilin peptidase [Candidatus Melainabacteria bacterium]
MIEIFVFVIGACFGSFFKLVVDRYGTSDSFIFKPSFCLKCNTNLYWWQNIPIISYLLLGGKCYFCKSKINVYSFYAELITASILLLIYLSLIKTSISYFEIMLFVFFALILIILSMFDIKHRIVPHLITYSGILILILIQLIQTQFKLFVFLNLGIAFIFMDILYFFVTLLKKYKPEINNIVVPILFWLGFSFYSTNIKFLIFACVFYFIFLGFKFSTRLYISSWFFIFIFILINFYKSLLIAFNQARLIKIFEGIGVIYFICEILFYFLAVLFLERFFSSKTSHLKENLNISTVLGGGDITLFALISVFLSFKLAFLSLFIASLLALISHFIMRGIKLFKGYKTSLQEEKVLTQYIPFIPYLAGACLIVILFVK